MASSKLRPGSHSFSGKWLVDNQCVIVTRKPASGKISGNNKRKRSKTYNVLSLNGGQANVPADKWVDFLAACAQDINLQIPIFYAEVELDTDRPRSLGVDLDYVFRDKYIEMSEILTHISCMHKTVCRFFPEGKNEAFILVTPRKQVRKQDQLVYKCGIHIVWPECAVNAIACLRVRAAWLNDLELKFGTAKNIDASWGSIVDESIYRNGLRLPGSAKCQPCSKCHNHEEKRVCCDLCYGEGRIYDLTNVYSPQMKILHDGTIEEKVIEFEKDTWAMLRRCCLRKPGILIRSDFLIPLGEPELMIKETKKKGIVGGLCYDTATDDLLIKPNPISGGGGGKKSNNEDLFTEDRKGMARTIRQKVEFDNDSVEVKGIVNFIHEGLAKVYEKVLIRSVWSNKARTSFWVTTKSSFCQNLNRNHNSNTIYFLITSKNKSLVQKCWCQCRTIQGRLSGKECRDYVSPPIRIPFDLAMTLFPTSSTSKKAAQGGGGGGSRRHFAPEMRSKSTFNLLDLANSILLRCQQGLSNRLPIRVMTEQPKLLQ